MRPEARRHLYDILRAAEKLEQFTEGKSLDDYEGDALLRSGVERQLGIVGEALNRIH